MLGNIKEEGGIILSRVRNTFEKLLIFGSLTGHLPMETLYLVFK